MKISVLTLFPEMLAPVLKGSILGRAVESGKLEIELINIRDFSTNKHKNADDYPFGGGAGMVMMAQPIFDAMESLNAQNARRIYLSPKGQVFYADKAKELSKYEHIILLCGHYEGIDQRVIDELIDEEISIGDYVLTGGELAALVIIDATARFIDGVLGSEESAEADSFSDGLLEYPQYTRPASFKGLDVPEVLLNGNHAKIARWRREQQLILTAKMRPDLLENVALSKEDLLFLQQLDNNS